MAFRTTWLDRAIASFSPGTALRRVRERAAYEIAARSYEAATPSRRNGGWVRGGSSADAQIALAGPALREHMRDLVRNNPHGANAVAKWVTNVIGNGIDGRPTAPTATATTRARDAWDRWRKTCDADGLLDLMGLQTLAFRRVVEDGEVLIRRRWRRATDRLPASMQVQIIEADLLDSAKDGAMPGGNYAIQGVEFDKIGRRVAYWLFPQHPANASIIPYAGLTSVRINADEVIHVYDRQRAQVRGTPWGTASMAALRDLGDYEAAEIVRKKIEACMVGILTGGDENDMSLGIPLTPEQQPGFYDAQGQQVERFEPGMFTVARGGRDVKFNTPTSNGSYEAYKRSMLHTIAAGFRLPYELLTGDLSQVNYSSIRAGLTEYRRLVESIQWQMVVPMMLDRLGGWWAEAAYLNGEIAGPDLKWEWSPPKFYSVDPLKDVMADLLEVRSGFASLSDKIAERGLEPETHFERIRETNALLDRLELTFDSDPRSTAKNGALQINISAGDGGQAAPQRQT
jgi:lambda family phage portal protein